MKQVLIDILDAIAYVLNAAPHDPKKFARTPPKGWHKATPEADVPARKSKALEVDLSVYTPEEILEMSEAEYRIKVGGMGLDDWQEARKQAEKMITKRRKSNAREVEF